MSPHRDAHLELCAGYVLGGLDDQDRRELERHLDEGCPLCEQEIVALSEGALVLAASAPPRTPPADLRARTLRAAFAARPPVVSPETAPAPGSESRSARAPRRLGWGNMALAAAAAVLAVSTAMLWRETDRLRGESAQTRARLQQAERDLAEARAWADLLEAPTARSVDFEPTPQGVELLRARATFDAGTRRAVIAFENARAPGGGDYQLWAIGPTGPTSLGLIRPDTAGRAVLRLEFAGDPAQLQAFAVSLEAAGGSPDPHAPKGPVVMVAKVAS